MRPDVLKKLYEGKSRKKIYFFIGFAWEKRQSLGGGLSWRREANCRAATRDSRPQRQQSEHVWNC